MMQKLYFQPCLESLEVQKIHKKSETMDWLMSSSWIKKAKEQDLPRGYVIW